MTLCIACGVPLAVTFVRAASLEDSYEKSFQIQGLFVSTLFETFLGFWFFVVGASIGSFLNVIAWRLPKGESLGGFSKCPHCQSMIAGKDKAPILSWLQLRGRCRSCRLPIARRYPIVESLAGLAFVVIFFLELVTGGTQLPDSAGPFGFAPFDEPQIPGVATSGAMMIGQVDMRLVLLCLTHAWTLCFLIGVSLFAWDRARVPVRWGLVGVSGLVLFQTSLPFCVVVPWRSFASDGFQVASRFVAFSTAVLGLGAGIGVARLISTHVFSQGDGSYLGSDQETRASFALLAGFAIIGVTVGWQATLSSAVLALVFAILCRIGKLPWLDLYRTPMLLPIVFLIQVGSWRWIDVYSYVPDDTMPGWVAFPMLILIYVLSIGYKKLSTITR